MEIEDNIPDAFRCCITFEIMQDPVILGTTGHTFEKNEIQTWLATHNTNPLTGAVLADSDRKLIPNMALRDAIHFFLQQRNSSSKSNASVPDIAPPSVVRRITLLFASAHFWLNSLIFFVLYSRKIHSRLYLLNLRLTMWKAQKLGFPLLARLSCWISPISCPMDWLLSPAACNLCAQHMKDMINTLD